MCNHLAQWNIVPERLPAVSGIRLPGLTPSMTASEYNTSVNLSHAGASRHCYFNSKRRFWMVLEDDCRFVEDPRKIVFNIIETLGKNNLEWSLVSLGCYSYDWQSPKENFDYATEPVLCRPTSWFPWGAHSYLVNRTHAERIIATWSACFNPADHLLLSEYRNDLGYLRRPSATYQEEYLSYHNGNGGGTMDTKKSADMSAEMIDKICQTRVELRT